MRASSQPLGRGIGFFEEGRTALLDSLILRLVTASLVATWWPGHFCCCQGQTAEAAEALSGGWAASVNMAEPDSGCCSPAPATPLDMTLDGGCGGGCETSGPVDGESCGCVQAPTDATAPTSAAAVHGGKQLRDTVDLLAALPATVTEIAAIGHRVRTCRGSPRSGPAQSLYALHCLLTT